MNTGAAGPAGEHPRDWMLGLTLHGIKLGLSNIRQLLDAADNPQQRYPIVHLAGTNGKGSVLALLDAMLRDAGYRTARFTSPHIIDLRERFLIDGAPIAEDCLTGNIRFFKEAAERAGTTPTFFEICTAIAFRAFAGAGIDIALIETGMGGRLDSTSAADPLITAITNIGLEHTRYLGSTLEKIAFEKAGILKPGVPAVTGAIAPGPHAVILRRAQSLGVPVYAAGQAFSWNLTGEPWAEQFSFQTDGCILENTPLSLAGKHQGENAAVAVMLARLLRDAFPNLDEGAIRRGLAGAAWPCRLERFDGDPVIIIDVAHNAAGAVRLAETVRGCVTVLAVADDKDAAGMIRALGPAVWKLILTRFQGKRALPVAALEKAAAGSLYTTAPDLAAALRMGIDEARDASAPLLITGSIYTAGEARQWLIEKGLASPLRF
jgi:dihydrofolate synthase / folylpolyglutamate synthase